jgi:hypothetical protein
MHIDRRRLPKATACLALMGLDAPLGAGTPADGDGDPAVLSWHALNRSLLGRARRASTADSPADKAGIERLIRDAARRRAASTFPL